MSSLAAALACALLSACGGGGGTSADTTAAPLLSATSPATILAVSSDTAIKTAATPPTITVRAYGSRAGNFGPLMEVRVDGLRIGLVEVRATEPRDYDFAAPGLTAGSTVDIVFQNDEMIGTEDRNLFVAWVTDGSQFMSPSQPAVVYDAGTGAEEV